MASARSAAGAATPGCSPIILRRSSSRSWITCSSRATGADLQILKVEIGGDTNSTDGSESSIEHSRGSISCSNGYEFWLMEQAKARNPSIKLYGLAWSAPGWISGGFWSTDTINYLVSWLNCAKSDGLTISYLGGWNERNYNISWVRAAPVHAQRRRLLRRSDRRIRQLRLGHLQRHRQQLGVRERRLCHRRPLPVRLPRLGHELRRRLHVRKYRQAAVRPAKAARPT